MITEIKMFGSTLVQSDNDAGSDNKIFQRISLDSIVPLEYIGSIELAVSSDLLMGSIRDGRLRVVSPIKVRCTLENGNIIAEADEINEFGFGKNTSESIIDLQRAIAELYFTLEKEQTRLGPDLQRVWNILQQKILKK